MNLRLQVDYIEARELFTKAGIDHSGKRRLFCQNGNHVQLRVGGEDCCDKLLVY